jgi:hypothetical protein
MIMKNKTTRKTLLQMSFQQTNKRGLAYNCEWCGEDSPFIAERYREDSHIWKRHLSLDCSPYYCTLCMFKATSQPAIKRHCRTFKPHLNQRGEVRLLDGRSAAGGVNGRSDDSKPRGRVSS